MIAAYRKSTKLPSNQEPDRKIQELMAAPKTARGKKTAKRRREGEHKVHEPKVRPKFRRDLDGIRTAGDDARRRPRAGVFITSSVKIDPHCAMPIAGRQLIQKHWRRWAGACSAVRMRSRPAAIKQVEFVLASDADRRNRSRPKCRIPTIAEDVAVELLLTASRQRRNSQRWRRKIRGTKANPPRTQLSRNHAPEAACRDERRAATVRVCAGESSARGCGTDRQRTESGG